MRIQIDGFAQVDGTSVDHEVVEVGPGSEIVSDGPIGLTILGETHKTQAGDGGE